MSSPAFFHEGMSPHAMDMSQDCYGGEDAGVVKRPMRVKVLYTIGDAANNMLARLQHTTMVPVVTMEDQTQIGVVQLHTCMQAIISHSPELMPTLEQDYTVYAYDYSEYETPLVGQGLLSRVLASASPTPSAPASQSGTMITGRVCKNLLAMLSNGVKETLEVKLKLVVVPTKHRNQYDKAMDSYRNTSRPTLDSMDFEMGGASFSMASEPDYSAPPQNSTNTQPQMPIARSNLGAIDSLHDLLTPPFHNGNNRQEFDGRSAQANSVSGGSRPGTPVQPVLSSSTIAGSNLSRPSSRASNRPTQPEASVEEPFGEEGPARKRAKLVSTDRRGRNGFGNQPDSLRVAASTAASIREFRPSVMDNSSLNSDMMPRAPTPRPAGKRLKPTNMSQSQSSLRRNSSLSDHQTPGLPSDQSAYDDAVASSPDIPSSPPVVDTYDDYRARAASSPRLPEPTNLNDSGFQSDIPTDVNNSDIDDAAEAEDRSRTKQEAIARWRASRIATNSRAEWTTYVPSKPVPAASIPTTVEDVNQFMSHNKALSAMGIRRSQPSDDAARLKDDAIKKAPTKKPRKRARSNADKSSASAQSPAEQSNVTNASNTDDTALAQVVTTPDDQATSPKEVFSMPQNAPRPSLQTATTEPIDLTTISAASRKTNASESIFEGPISVKTVLPPQKPDSRKPKRADRAGGMSRSKTWTAPSSDFDIASEADIQTNIANGTSAGKKPVMSHAANRQATIRRQLRDSIANGQMPTFCHTCGNIETPTWRPFYVRKQAGKVGDIPDGDGVHAIHAVEKELGKDSIDEILVYKKWSMLTMEEREDNNFRKMQLCNPCGNYFQKNRVFRPKVLWDEESKAEAKREIGKKARGSGKNRVRVREPNALSSDAPSGPTNGEDMAPTPSETAQQSAPTKAHDAAHEQLKATPMGPPELPIHGESDRSGDDALSRAIQQSPARAVFDALSRQHEDPERLTPNPVRRLLFPSPRKSGEFKTLDSPSGSTDGVASQKVADNQDNDKENCPPSMDQDHSLTDLFNFSMTPFTSPQTARILAKNLKTPTSSRRSRNALGQLPDGTNNVGGEGSAMPVTPSRIPRASPGALTPFYKDLLEKFGGSSSPGQLGNIDLQDFFSGNMAFDDQQTSFNFEGQTIFGSPSQFLNDFLSSEAMLPSDMPMPSSPPVVGGASATANAAGRFLSAVESGTGNAIEFYEDATATTGPEAAGVVVDAPATTDAEAS